MRHQQGIQLSIIGIFCVILGGYLLMNDAPLEGLVVIIFAFFTFCSAYSAFTAD